jgi:hypothetical protein
VCYSYPNKIAVERRFAVSLSEQWAITRNDYGNGAAMVQLPQMCIRTASGLADLTAAGLPLVSLLPA